MINIFQFRFAQTDKRTGNEFCFQISIAQSEIAQCQFSLTIHARADRVGISNQMRSFTERTDHIVYGKLFRELVVA
ncbi:hypothetical protein D3C80_1493930 [compost metagenome]